MNNHKKGIILAGGKGSRLSPLTLGVSKQLLPIYNKPMIYYPLTTLMMSGVRNFLIIINPHEEENFKRLLGDGSQWGINITYKVQLKPDGIAQAFILGEEFIGESSVSLILGDNLFYGEDLKNRLIDAFVKNNGATIFVHPVKNPERYGVVTFNKDMKPFDIIEKPQTPSSRYAVTGLYIYENTVVDIAKKLKPSKRGELEITDINKIFLESSKLNVQLLGRGAAWLDTGTFESLHEAGSFIKTLDNRQSLKIGYPEEIAFNLGWISNSQFSELIKPLLQNSYGNYLKEILDDN
tara:strand:- start:206 stop:1087 length:882 start_codon:yes stop_codon:yes gene_type:complete